MNLKQFFDETGIRQTHIAAKANVSPACVWKAISGADIKLSTAVKICEATQWRVTPKDLYNSLLCNHEKDKGEKHHNKNDTTKHKGSKINIS